MTTHDTLVAAANLAVDGPDELGGRFRDVMAGVATPVSVITAMVGHDPHGTTVSAFASLSMTPPMVVVALDKKSDLLAQVRIAGSFGVNVLGAAQSELAMTFAKKGGPAKFAGVDWVVENGLPCLPDAPGWLACEVADLVDGGDHVLALGHVVAARTVGGEPLTYHGRVFGTHSAFDLSA